MTQQEMNGIQSHGQLQRDDHFRCTTEGMTGVRQQTSGERQILPLTCTFAPLAGLEPATYGLVVRQQPSTW